MKMANQEAFYNSCRNMADWLLILIGLPRQIAEDEKRLVKLVGLPYVIYPVFYEWCVKHHPTVFIEARDGDGHLRSIPEKLWHEFLIHLFVTEDAE